MSDQNDSHFCKYLRDFCKCHGIWCHYTTGDCVERAEPKMLTSGSEKR